MHEMWNYMQTIYSLIFAYLFYMHFFSFSLVIFVCILNSSWSSRVRAVVAIAVGFVCSFPLLDVAFFSLSVCLFEFLYFFFQFFHGKLRTKFHFTGHTYHIYLPHSMQKEIIQIKPIHRKQIQQIFILNIILFADERENCGAFCVDFSRVG